MSKPNWACSVCGMWSGRKESVRRHIDNPNIHMGNGIEISFSDSLIARLTGTTLPNPVTSNKYNRGNSNFFPKTPEKMFALFEKAFSQKMADKIADNIVNFDLTHQYWPTYYNYNYNLPNVNYTNDFFTSIKDLCALEMQVCPKCLMIEPAKVCYAKGEPNVGIRSFISLPCCPPPSYQPESQKGQHLRVLMESRIYPHLKKWLDVLMPSPKDRRIVAFPVSQLSPSNSRCKVRLSVNNSESDSTTKKYVAIEYLKEKCYDLLLSSHTESNHWSTRVVQNGSTTLADDNEVMDYLACTKHSTYGFFRTIPKTPFHHSERISSVSIYLIMLLIGNKLIPAIDNVLDTV